MALIIFPSQNQQNGQFLAICLTHPDTKLKNVNFKREKLFQKLENLHTQVFGHANHNALCKNFV